MLNLLKPKDASVPTLADISPSYARLSERREALTKRRAEAIAEVSKIAKARDLDRAPPKTIAVITARDKRVEALINGEEYPGAPPPLAEPAMPSRYWELSREIDEIQDFALPEIEARLRQEAAIASSVICNKFRDAHRKMVREIATTLRDLHEANTQYWQFSDAMGRAGAAWGALGPSFVRAIGHPEDRRGPLGIWFKEAKEAGHISESEIPESLR